MSTCRFMLTALLLAACAPAPKRAEVSPNPMEWRIALPPVSSPPSTWAHRRPASPAAAMAASMRGDRLFVQVDDHCALGVHAHARLVRDSMFVTVHWGTVTERSTGAAPNCYENCDLSCPYLFSGRLPVSPRGRVVAILFPSATPEEEERGAWRVVGTR